MRPLVLSVFLLLASTPAQAATLTVGPGPTFDFPTLTQAMLNAQSGETVFVAEGVYDATLGEVFPIVMKSGVDVVGASDGQSPLFVATPETDILTFTSVTGASLSDLHFTSRFQRCDRMILAATSDLVFTRVEISDCWAFRAALEVSGDSHVTLIQNQFQSNLGSAIRSETVSTVRLLNCLIADHRPWPMQNFLDVLVGGVFEIVNCTLVRNQGTIVRPFTQPIVSTIRNSILWNWGIEISGNPTVLYSAVRGGFAGATNISAYPQFVDPENGDYRLADGSPCVSRGANGLVVPDIVSDLDSNPRIQGGSVDMGAYESPASHTSGPLDNDPLRLYVKQNLFGVPDGRTWDTAFPKILPALFRSKTGGEVWVAQGEYGESLFTFHTGSLVGGFTGYETQPAERVLPASATVVNATGLDRPVLAHLVVSSFSLDRMTLTGGHTGAGAGINTNHLQSLNLVDCALVRNVAEDFGGAISSSGMLTLNAVRCAFDENSAIGRRSGGSITNGQGGAFNLSMGSVSTFKDCTFNRNYSLSSGAAIRSNMGTSCSLEGCEIADNYCVVGSLSTGVALYFRGSNAALKDCIVRDNQAGEVFRSLLPSAILCEDTNPAGERSITLDGVTILDNANSRGLTTGSYNVSVRNSIISRNGGAGVVCRSGIFEHCEISGNGRQAVSMSTCNEGETRFVDCLFEGNGFGEAGASGTPILNVQCEEILFENCSIVGNRALGNQPPITFSGDSIEIANCLIAGNTGEDDYIALSVSGDLRLVNSTIVDNTTSFEFPPHRYVAGDSGNLEVVNSIIRGGNPAISWVSANQRRFLNNNLGSVVIGSDIDPNNFGSGNINADPEFVQPWDGTTGDWRLLCSSPCIDSGTSTGAPAMDLAGLPRPIGAGFDMGAYESCILDFNQDGAENPRDLLAFPPEWYRPADAGNAAFNRTDDLGGAERIDGGDLVELVEEW